MNRSEFIQKSGKAVAGACLLGLSTQFISCNTRVLQSSLNGEKILVPLSEFDDKKDPYGIVKTDKIQGPIFVYRKSEKKYLAFLMICTHKRCEIFPSKGVLVCPCHGSTFSFEGKVQKSPAQMDLYSYNTRIEGEQLEISL